MAVRKSYGATAYAIWKTLAISVPTVVDAIRGRVTIEKCDQRLRDWSRAVVTRAEVRLSVEGVEHASGAGACVLMSNHQSHYDIPICYVAFPGRLRMVAKQELFRIPVWGRAMREAGFISVDRSGNRGRTRESMNLAGQAIKRGISIWIAPEGTRSPDGRLGQFKRGGFLLAQQMNVPIVPMTIDGSKELIPKNHYWVRPGALVRVRFGAPIDPVGRAVPELMEEVRAFMESNLPGAGELPSS